MVELSHPCVYFVLPPGLARRSAADPMRRYAMHEEDKGFWEDWIDWSDLYELTDGYEPHGNRLERLTTEERALFSELLRLQRQIWFDPSDPILRTEGDQVVSVDSIIQEDILFEHVLLMVEAARDSRVALSTAAAGPVAVAQPMNLHLTVEVIGDIAEVRFTEGPVRTEEVGEADV